MARVAALIPAAGEGARLGKGPKAFLELNGRSLLERAVSALETVDEILVGVSAEMLNRTREVVEGKAKVVVGGQQRQDTVYNLLKATEAELVLVHDAARPFLGAEVVTRVLEAVQEHGAASVVVPVADTLIAAATGEAVDRSLLRAVQTPQGFLRERLLEAHEAARTQGVYATDDAALVRALGHEVALVTGSTWLMKITTPTDLEVAQALAPIWDRR